MSLGTHAYAWFRLHSFFGPFFIYEISKHNEGIIKFTPEHCMTDVFDGFDYF